MVRSFVLLIKNRSGSIGENPHHSYVGSSSEASIAFFFSNDCLKALCKIIGKIIAMDPATANVIRSSLAKVQVEMDVLKVETPSQCFKDWVSG